MAKCGSQCYLCDVPIRFDTYIGCSHGCKYCFAEKFRDMKERMRSDGATGIFHYI